MCTDNPAEAARALVFGRTMLCGVNCLEALEAARSAAFAGFVFVPESPRHIAVELAHPLAELARRFGVLPVGVFRDAAPDVVADASSRLGLHAVQLHGRENADYVRELRSNLPDSCEIWAAVSVGREPLVGRGADRLVFDNADGGSGRTFDWSLVSDHPDLPNAIVAGGIGLHNARAAQKLGAFAIDIGSAVDERPGRKSPEKIADLFEALRPDCRERLRACA
jgi:indole-3-glycerol phosphate synthase/phosphoribosylanthranilate isomerase